MPQSGFANMLRQNINRGHVGFVIAVTVLTITAAFIFTGPCGLAVTAFTVLGFIAAIAYSYNEFKGVSGDLTGHALVIAELCGLFALALV